MFSATSSASSFLRSSVGRRWNESFGFDGEGNEETASPFLSPPLHSLLLVSFPLSSGGANLAVFPLSFTPQCWQTGQTSWVGPWCQWVGTAAEVKRNGRRGGRETHKRVSFLDKGSIFFFPVTFVQLPKILFFMNTCASFLQKFRSRRVL